MLQVVLLQVEVVLVQQLQFQEVHYHIQVVVDQEHIREEQQDLVVLVAQVVQLVHQVGIIQELQEQLIEVVDQVEDHIKLQEEMELLVVQV
tara:strand:+ start:254 stop:526 length:273 start_codon:yes stop_codon:yes gene_type:complete